MKDISDLFICRLTLRDNKRLGQDRTNFPILVMGETNQIVCAIREIEIMCLQALKKGRRIHALLHICRAHGSELPRKPLFSQPLELSQALF